jgi:tetratricopeptide (TPR) repeat protein
MHKRFCSALVTSAMLFAADSAVSCCWAKPPDLPVTTKQTCLPVPTVPVPQAPSLPTLPVVRAMMSETPVCPPAPSVDPSYEALKLELPQPGWWGASVVDWIRDNFGDYLDALPTPALEALEGAIVTVASAIGDLFHTEVVESTVSQALPAACYLPNGPQYIPATPPCLGGVTPVSASLPPTLPACGMAPMSQAMPGCSTGWNPPAMLPSPCPEPFSPPAMRVCLPVSCSMPAAAGAIGQAIVNQLPLPINVYSSDPNERNERMDILLQQSEDLEQIRGEWRRFWMNDQPSHMTYTRVSGGIGPGYTESIVAETTIFGTVIAACNGQAVSTRQDSMLSDEEYKAQVARRFYEIGQKCEEKGDVAMARNCYEEATRVCPNCKFGELASARFFLLSVNVVSIPPVGGFETQEEPPQYQQETVPDTRPATHVVREAKRMFELGQRLEKAGDLENAHRCYQETHLICPDCEYGKQAVERMAEIERSITEPQRRQGNIEEQESPVDGQSSGHSEVEPRQTARAYFQLAEYYRHTGNLNTAYYYYQESHLACPDCKSGMKAIERMRQIETHRDRFTDPSEEQDEPDTRPFKRPTLSPHLLLWIEPSW